VRNGRLDVRATNRLGSALYADVVNAPDRPNLARFIFLGKSAAAEFYVIWERLADDAVSNLRAEASRDPYDRPSLTWSVNCRCAVKFRIR
jgi:MmyB-like transcription regulator ligand binding domain